MFVLTKSIMNNEKTKITYDDFKKVEIKIGKILSAEKVPDTDRLLQLSVDLGEEEPRQIISGIAEYFESPEELVGVHCSFVTNLEPRTIRGYESNGMILAVKADDDTFSLLKSSNNIPAGTNVS